MAVPGMPDRRGASGARLEGRVAIVTGSDSGIGQAIADALGTAGAAVAVTFRSDEDGARETAARIEAQGGRCLVQRLDVQDEASVAAVFDATEKAFGPADILVNNAGSARRAPRSRRPLRRSSTGWCGRISTGRSSAAANSSAGGEAEGGKIVNVTSVHEAIPSPGKSAYGAAKGGLLTFTRSLALELAPKRINVNAVALGLIRTPMTEERMSDPEARERELPNIPWRRPGEPREVAALVLYLVSAESDYVTGQSFTIDGGLEMNWGQGA